MFILLLKKIHMPKWEGKKCTSCNNVIIINLGADKGDIHKQ